ncbi:cytochrome c biogenesis B [Iris pallida]|uniref:Cytochrome c biogenesis B (Mitochondrion) n=1 Tax=Iris pallida TaxID=29817 RepID=A0AAX6FKT9_IRIPA|nr:cytochrome c biogenesis B [Iris pallida]
MNSKERREMKRLFLELFHKPLYTNHEFFIIPIVYRGNALNDRF